MLKGAIEFTPDNAKTEFPSFLIPIVLVVVAPIGTLPKLTSLEVIFSIAPNTFTLPFIIVVVTDVCVGDETTKPLEFKLKLPGKVFDFNFNVIKLPALPVIIALDAAYKTTLITPSEGLLTASE